jgi:C-terminal processing protease CtpA/Prc
MKKLTLIIILICAILVSLPNCKKDPDPEGIDTAKVISDATKYVNNWIWSVMNEVYLWNVYIPQNLEPEKQPDPEKFFEKLLYSKDRFSWISDDYDGLMDEYVGVAKSIGYSPTFGRFSNSDGVFMIIEYVFPDSPAEIAGLKRGDIVLKINGVDLNIDNYIDLFYSETQIVTLGYFDGSGISLTDKQITMAAQVIALDPAIHYEIKEINGHKIGYLVYVEFTSGEDSVYLKSLGQIFDTFEASGITDLVVDFRYNPGGDIQAAAFFASAVAPASVIESHEVLVRFEYNSIYNEYFRQQEGINSPRLVYRFPDNQYNINLNKIYFLTTNGTASACEFTMSGLEPYMDVVLVGENTYGKYTGAWIIPDLAEPRKHNWALVPIVMKYANADGVTDFDTGLPVDIEIEDDLINAVPFGDLNDPVLYKAIESIVGSGQMPGKKASVSPVSFAELENPFKEQKRNLFISPEFKK